MAPRYRGRDKDPDPELGGRGSAGRTGFPNEGLLRAGGKPEGASCREGAHPQGSVSALPEEGPPGAKCGQEREVTHEPLEQQHLLSPGCAV